MYICQDCEKEFNLPEKIFEKHGLTERPFEAISVCPECGSSKITQKVFSHCRCCGAKLRDGSREYCDSTCRRRGEKMWADQRKRLKEREKNPLILAIREVEAYNKANGSRLSYGQYFSGRR